MQRIWDDESHLIGLSYGVMVALQFLVLPVKVRILVRQPQRRFLKLFGNLSFFIAVKRVYFKKNAYFWHDKEIMRKMNTINEIQDEIIEEFAGLTDWMDKYSYIIELGNAVEPLEEKHKTPDNIIDGCQSRVWLVAEENEGVINFRADSDAIIVKGLISLLIRVLSGNTPQEILDADLYFMKEIGLQEHLSPTRSNGLLAMVKQMRVYALAYKAKSEN